MIDPQTQTNQWDRRTYSEDLRIVRLSESTTYPKVINSALRVWHIVLIKDILEEIDLYLIIFDWKQFSLIMVFLQ